MTLGKREGIKMVSKKNNTLEYFENTEDVSREIYYHYTSLEAFYNIICSKSFRLRSLISTNDKKELFYNIKSFFADFNSILEEESDPNKKLFYESVKTSIESNFDAFKKDCCKKSEPYALCLSEKRDNLTHWDRYADGCRGICIGFNVASLTVLFKRASLYQFGYNLYDIDRVKYNDSDRKKYIKSSLARFLNMFDQQDGNTLTSFVRSEKFVNNGYKYAAAIFIQLSKFVKDDYFVDEDEVRLYHDSAAIKSTKYLINLIGTDINKSLCESIKNNLDTVINELRLEMEHFDLLKSGIRGYKELYLGSVWGSGTIPEIILGPLNAQNRRELKRFLSVNGLSGTNIINSKVPIR